MRYDVGRRPNAQTGMGVRFTPNQLAEMHGSPQYSPNPQQQQQQQQQISNSSQPQPQVYLTYNYYLSLGTFLHMIRCGYVCLCRSRVNIV